MDSSKDHLTLNSTERISRCWFSFRLRTLLLVVAAICVSLAWRVEDARKQRQAVLEVLRVGGTVEYDYEKEPHWLARFIGIDFIHNVTMVLIHIDSDSPQDIHSVFPYLFRFRRLKTLSIYDGVFRDDDLRYLAGLTNLVSLELCSNNITGDGLKYLAELNNLRLLELHDNPITDKSLRPIALLPKLTWLGFSKCALTDECLATLAQIKSLRRIDIENTQITPEGERRLKERCANLKINPPPTVW